VRPSFGTCPGDGRAIALELALPWGVTVAVEVATLATL
jgi:hypothetical protein